LQDRSLRGARDSARPALGLVRGGLTAVSARNLVDPVAVHLLRTELQVKALAYHAGQEAAHRVPLPARRELASSRDRPSYSRRCERSVARALQQEQALPMTQLIASSQTLTSRSSVRSIAAFAPHHRSPTSAIGPAGQDLGAPWRPELATLPLQSRPNAMPVIGFRKWACGVDRGL
jgi:hypothetical protein